MTWFAWYGVFLMLAMILACVSIMFFTDRSRRTALKVADLLTDGRPRGCKCPPNPGMNALPCDNKHINSPRCPLTRGELGSDAVAEINKRLDDLEIALQILAPQHEARR